MYCVLGIGTRTSHGSVDAGLLTVLAAFGLLTWACGLVWLQAKVTVRGVPSKATELPVPLAVGIARRSFQKQKSLHPQRPYFSHFMLPRPCACPEAKPCKSHQSRTRLGM